MKSYSLNYTCTQETDTVFHRSHTGHYIYSSLTSQRLVAIFEGPVVDSVSISIYRSFQISSQTYWLTCTNVECFIKTVSFVGNGDQGMTREKNIKYCTPQQFHSLFIRITEQHLKLDRNYWSRPKKQNILYSAIPSKTSDLLFNILIWTEFKTFPMIMISRKFKHWTWNLSCWQIVQKLVIKCTHFSH